MKNQWILPVIIVLLFLMFASNTGIAMSSRFLANLCDKCNQKNCWSTLGLIMNAVLFLVLLFLILRTYNSEGFCDAGPMNEDGTWPRKVGADGQPVCTDDQRDAQLIRRLHNPVEYGRGTKSGMSRVIRGKKVNKDGDWVDAAGAVVTDSADAAECDGVDADGWATVENNELCKSTGLADTEEEVLTSCMFHTLSKENDEECDEIVPSVSEKLDNGEDVTDRERMLFDMCLARDANDCNAFSSACADAFGGLSTCMSGAGQPGGSFGDGGFCRCG